jgi:hypothetical protein
MPVRTDAYRWGRVRATTREEGLLVAATDGVLATWRDSPPAARGREPTPTGNGLSAAVEKWVVR